jgi:hypothetical protein
MAAVKSNRTVAISITVTLHQLRTSNSPFLRVPAMSTIVSSSSERGLRSVSNDVSFIILSYLNAEDAAAFVHVRWHVSYFMHVSHLLSVSPTTLP